MKLGSEMTVFAGKGDFWSGLEPRTLRIGHQVNKILEF